MKQLENIHLSMYWKCQLIGWTAASLYWGYAASLTGTFDWRMGGWHFLSDIVLYIFVTHQYRNIALKKGWNLLPLKGLIRVLIPAALILGIAFLIVTSTKIFLLRQWFLPAYTETFMAFLNQNWLAVLMAGVRLMSIWLLAYHLYHYAQREIMIARENARLQVITKDAQLNNLSAQLNPHFFFNSLNNIKSLIIENPASARRAVDLLADLLRTSLNKKDVMLIPLKEELNMVKDYLELEKLRFEERLQEIIVVDDQLGDTLVLRLSIQTLVENAIKHGIDKQKEGGLVKITVVRKGEFIEIRVQNPGKLDEERSKQGLGLKNLEERVRLQFKESGKFESAAHNETVLTTLQIPAL
jgi:sensor histidine kinase YesM